MRHRRLALVVPIIALVAAMVPPATAVEPIGDAAPERTAHPSTSPTPVAPGTPAPSTEPGASLPPDTDRDPSASEPPDPTASPVPSARPVPSTTPTPWPGKVNLFRLSAWVRQYTGYTCTAASVQTMANLVLKRSDRSFALQMKILRYAQAHDSLERSRGSDPKGWAAAMTHFGRTRYDWKVFDSRASALRYAAKRLAATRKPVGLLVWRGRHAWTMTGFTSRTDPRTDPRAEITGVYVAPPLVGTDPRPNTFIRTRDLTTFARYMERDGLLAWVGHYVVVTPR